MPPLTTYIFEHDFSKSTLEISLYTKDFKLFEKRLKELVKEPKKWKLKDENL